MRMMPLINDRSHIVPGFDLDLLLQMNLFGILLKLPTFCGMSGGVTLVPST